MLIKFFKFLLILIFYQSPLYSKIKTLNDFNLHHLSNYFSGIVAYENKQNLDALKFFRSSRYLIDKHDPYLERYIYSLVLENKVNPAINEIKGNLTESNSNFFEAYILLALDSLKKKNFEKSKSYLEQSSRFIKNDRLAQVIYVTLKQYLYVFKENKILKPKQKLGNFSLINEVFQRCYLEDKNTQTYFLKLINDNSEFDFSRYIFFNIIYLVEKNKFDETQNIINNLDYANTTLLLSQGKKWVEEKKFKEFGKIFSCQNPSDIISEFFFLIANLYSSNKNYEQSNFYLNISYYLNPKFKFNLSLLANNYFLNSNYEKSKKTLEYFNEKDDFYYWFKIKKKTQIMSKELNNLEALNFINKEFEKIKDPSVNMIFDVANFNKNSEKYQTAINYYNKIVPKIETDSTFYAEVLYRRGSCYERLGKNLKSDQDLLKSLAINPDDSYVLNYLAYSWLERDYKIDAALEMLEKAYETRSNDPYIIDSIGWAYYMIDDFLKAETFLKRAVELMPDDPTVNDHYGDILWKLDRKIQARYFWATVLNLKETNDKMKKNIMAKLVVGLKAD